MKKRKNTYAIISPPISLSLTKKTAPSEVQKKESILGEEGTLSFDIINWKNWSTNTTKVMNVKYHMAKTMLGDVSAEMTNIPITETGVEFLSSEATVSNGVKFSTFDFTEQRDPAREPLLSSPDNSVYMTIYFRQEYWHWDNF